VIAHRRNTSGRPAAPKTRALVSVALGAGLIAGGLLTIPPRAVPAVTPSFAPEWPTARGAFHVHSQRSDGAGTIDSIAQAAARANLQFVVITDHGDGTRPPEPPQYRAGVLVLDGVEISTDGGHYVAVGLPAAPYPLGGFAEDVVDDVRRFGGLGVAAHPGSAKPELAWQAWDAPVDGLEWLNADSEWRDEPWPVLAASLLSYPLRPVETIARLLDRPDAVLRQWDNLARQRRVAAVAAADAHARIAWAHSDTASDDTVLAHVPSYEASFAAFANHVILSSPLTGRADVDAALVLEALREGRVVTVIDGVARLGALDLRATSGGNVARPGEYLDLNGPAVIEARIAAASGTRLVVRRDGEPIYDTQEPALRIDVGGTPGAYRLEAFLAGQDERRDIPWVLANPFYVGLRERHRAGAGRDPVESKVTTRTPVAVEAWQAEASGGSSSALDVISLEDGGQALAWRFSLARGPRARQFAAVRFPLPDGLGTHDRILLRLRGDRPARIWVQLRARPDAANEMPPRWGRTVPVHEEFTDHQLPLESFRMLGGAESRELTADAIDSLLLVADTVNTSPGSGATIQIRDLWLAH
jgi:hypothetical protein